jgi:hypothetical protein
MPLTEDEERAEHERRMDQMAVNIEKMRSDMVAQQNRLAIETRWENRKFAVSAIIGAAALVGAGIAIGNYLTKSTTQTINVHLDQPLTPPAATQK